MIRKYLILFLVTFNVLLTYSQTLHVLLFVNEQEQGREIDRRADMRNMYKFWGDIAGNIGYEYSPVKCTPSTFTAFNIDKEIRELSIEKSDIVVFYYSGHGYNDESDIWPSLNLLDRNYRQIDIMKKIKEVSLNAKLILCIADCCNKQLTSSYDFTASYDALEDNNALTELFKGFKGKKSIIMSASKQGQYSWSHKQYGAYYGNCFRQVLSRLSISNPTWDIVLNEISDLTLKYTERKQKPQFNITQSGDPFEN